MAYDKVVDSTVLDGYFSDIADAIRDKDGTQNTYTPQQMPQAIEDIPSGGGDTFYDVYFENDSSYSNDDITTIPAYCFANSQISSISLPNLTIAGEYSMHQCLRLTSIYLPSLTILGRNALHGAGTSIDVTDTFSIDLPEVTTLDSYALSSTGAENIILHKVVSIAQFALTNNRKLKNITFPASFDGVVNSSILKDCTALTKVTFEGNVTAIAHAAFQNNDSCMEYDFSHCTAVPTLSTIYAFTGIPTNSVIKVPASLETEWKAATNWSTYASHITGV